MSRPDDLLEERRRRLGTALHQLATDLARERRRVRELERELAELRSRRREAVAALMTTSAKHNNIEEVAR